MRSLPLACFLVSALASHLAAYAANPTRVEIPNAAQPQLTVTAEGRVYVAYGHGNEVFVARSDDGGATFSPAAKAASVPKLMLGMRRGPRIAAHGEHVTVTLIAHELLAFHSANGGRSWSGPTTLNEVATSAREGLHDLAAGPDGKVFVTWLDLRNGAMELWGAQSDDAGRTWGRNAPIYRSPDKTICECCHPTALFDAAGDLAVMWRNSIAGARDMWITTRPKGAAKFAAARKLGEGTWKLNACPMDGGNLVALGGGKFGAVWQRAGDVFMSGPEGAEIRLGKGKQPVAVQIGAEPVVVWQQGTDLVSTRGLTGGEPLSQARDARFPSLVSLPHGKGALLAYERGPAKGATTVTIDRL